MKPPPPDHLLGPGQSWIVVQAPGWVTTEVGGCVFRPEGSLSGFCNYPAVILKEHPGMLLWIEYLCEKHMGTHRWIDEGVVMQWRADPPWEYTFRKPALPPRKRSKKE